MRQPGFEPGSQPVSFLSFYFRKVDCEGNLGFLTLGRLHTATILLAHKKNRKREY